MAAIEANDLSKRLGDRWALARVSLFVPSGSVAAVVGPNGSGKTTLVRCLATLIEPDFGSASIGGHDGVRDRERARLQLGVVLDSSGGYADLSARENLDLLSRLGVSGAGQTALACLERAGLAGAAANRPLRECSAGMRRRFQIARVLMLSRGAVLLDEPEAHLDASGIELVRRLLAEWKSEGVAVLLSTHALDLVSDLVDSTLRLTEGRVSASS
jgi:ABC-type multidrug transport system ATPase subunit